ncbi:stage II sporulation protein M [Salinilacihabitans rarus]|uniref:stage II sporulation protein M n=1 Tax=Salinilacihabitans rarus TaxID=2961596 RepID=UPI0020C8B1C1|nr:stage II sporulation protein M [Salinilacihabitans rarus]
MDASQSRVGRGWTAVAAVVLLAALGTAVAAVERDAPLAAAGVVAVALATAAAPPAVPGALDTLRAAWREHRRYVGAAAGLFGLGAVAGALLLVAGVDLLELVVELLDDELVPADGGGGGVADDTTDLGFTARFFVVQNTPPFLFAIAGAPLTVGLLTAFVMVFNGVVVGNVGYAVGREVGFDAVAVLLVPHGVFELTALFLAAGVGFRLLHRLVERVRGSREAFVTRAYLRRTASLVGVGWLLLVLAAFVEAYATVALAEWLLAAPAV